MEGCLKDAHARSELRDGVDVRAVADFIVAACTGMQMYSWIVSGRKDLAKRTASMWQVLLPGIATESTLGAVKATTRRAGALVR